MNYLSDDEENDNVINEPTFDELYPQDELDEETLEILRKHANKSVNEDMTIISNKKVKEPKERKPQKQKIVKSLADLIKEQEEKKPKKWKSDRAESKKKTGDDVPMRKFNPRLPPYRTLEKKKETTKPVDAINEDLFPSLKKLSLGLKK